MVAPLGAPEVISSATPANQTSVSTGALQVQPSAFQVERSISVDQWWPITLPMDYGSHKGIMTTHA